MNLSQYNSACAHCLRLDCLFRELFHDALPTTMQLDLKLNFFLSKITHASRLEHVWGGGEQRYSSTHSYTQHWREVMVSFTPLLFHPTEGSSDTHWLEGWMSPLAGEEIISPHQKSKPGRLMHDLLPLPTGVLSLCNIRKVEFGRIWKKHSCFISSYHLDICQDLRRET
jgi:hypothetical protein